MQCGAFPAGVVAGLCLHEGEFAGLAERVGSELAAGVAIDASSIDEKRPLHILENGVAAVRHTYLSWYFGSRQLCRNPKWM